MGLNQGMSAHCKEGSMNEEIALAAPREAGILSFCFVCTFADIFSLFRMSRSLRPSCGASTVMKSALNPMFSAFCTTCLVNSLSLFTYNCHHCVCPGDRAACISSIVQLAKVGHNCGMPAKAAPRVKHVS